MRYNIFDEELTISWIPYFCFIYHLQRMGQSYMRANNQIEVAENEFKDGRPGRMWLKSFMKRNKLSLKKRKYMCC